MEENRGLTIKGLLIRLILIVIFIFLLIWLFPMPDLKPLNNQIFADNLDRMKNVAKTYYTTERLPKDINTSKKMTLREMIDNKLILPLMDSNGKYCSKDDSYIEITKLENEYVIKVYLSCTDKKDYIVEHFGCYDICSDTCKMLETTTTAGTVGRKATKKVAKVTTKRNEIVTTKKHSKIYEYQFVRNECTEKFDKYVCPSGYTLTGNSCFKNGSKVVSESAKKKTTTITDTDTKDAKAVTSSSSKTIDANCRNEYLTSTINAGYKKTTYSAGERITTQKITANATNTYDIKGAVATTTTTTASYNIVQNYDIISADVTYSGSKWQYVSTLISRKSDLDFVGENEKLIYVEQWKEFACESSEACATTVTYYKYYRYKKVNSGNPTYSCSAYPGYSLYDTNKCRKATTQSKSCPSGYTDNGSGCSKKTTTYSCSKYGSSYKLNSSNNTCVKTTTTYSCPKGTTKTSDPKYCSKNVTEYYCPSGTTMVDGNKCVKYHDYYCPANTSTKTYTLNGTKCTVKTKVKVCSCPSGTVQTTDKTHCVKTDSSTTYTCKDYPGYTLNGKKCTKTTSYDKITYSCDKGYTLSGTMCYKTVSTKDTKCATKTYKPVCELKYKWSTSTKINGWNYTGNKRAIN